MADDGLKKYNTGAYVPEGTSNDGVVVGGGSRAVNDAGVWNENTSESRGGAQEEASGARDVSMSGLSGKSQEETGNGPRMQNGSEAEKMGSRGDSPVKKSSKKKWGWVVVAILVVLTAAGVGVWWALSRGNVDSESDTTQGEDISQDESETPTNQIKELSLDDELVQRLYGKFERVGLWMSGTENFYVDEGVRNGDLSKVLMIAVAMPSVAGTGDIPCTGEYDGVIGDSCYSGDTIRARIKEIFGEDVSFEDGDRNDDVTCRWEYSAKNDEFYGFVGCGGSCQYGVHRDLDRAEQRGDNIYLYETAYGETCQALYHVNGDLIAEMKFDENGNVVKGFEADDYRDQMDQFKWTFTKNTEGSYVFAGLEQVK